MRRYRNWNKRIEMHQPVEMRQPVEIRQPVEMHQPVEMRPPAKMHRNMHRNMHQNNITVLDTPLFNIFITASYPPEQFRACLKSILEQTYTRYRVIVSYSDDRCKEYLNEYQSHENITIFKSYQDDKSPENIYINEALSKADEGRNIVLNDSDTLTHNMVLEQLRYNMQNNNNNILYWKVKEGDKIFYPKNVRNINREEIACSGFCFHSNYTQQPFWTGTLYNKTNFIVSLLQQKKLRHVFIDMVLVIRRKNILQLPIKTKGKSHRLLNTYKKKICVIYVYYERKNEQKNQTNLAFFMKYGLDKSRWRDMDITTLFIINGHQCEVLIPSRDDIFVHKQDNCSDWEGWHDGIKYFEKKYRKPIYDSFSHLCLINASSFGPVYEDGKERHWVDPFLNKMREERSVICSPCANILPDIDIGGPGLRIVPIFVLLIIDKNIYNLLINTQISMNNNKYINTIYGHKTDKIDAVVTGEYGLSKILLENNYKISSLVVSDDKYRIDFYRLTNSDLKNSIFIKNNWRWDNSHASQPVLYNYCMNFANIKLNYTNEFTQYVVNYNALDYKYKSQGTMIKSYNLPIRNGETTYWTSFKDLYDKFLYSEEVILFPIQNYSYKNCVIYAHYDKDNIIKDYVINNLKILMLLKFDILFYTASYKIKNIDILPCKINYIKNIGHGTDWYIWLSGLHKCSKYERILLLNDSLILGINGINNMRQSIATMRNKDIDLWGHWDSSEIMYHYIGTPIEIKQGVRKDLISFIEENLPKCNTGWDFVIHIETKMIAHLTGLGYKTDVIIKENMILSQYFVYKKYISCPSHNPCFLKKWIHLPVSFAIKWKYVLPYLLFNNITHPFFNYLLRFLHTSEDFFF